MLEQRQLGRFELVRPLGQGAMGVVYEALDRDGGKRVALKTLRRSDAESVLRLKHEFRALADIEHPNLISLGELFEVDGQWFFTMELIEGVDLLSYVRASATSASDVACDLKKLRRALVQLVAALDALHSRGLVHRDVKPSNILVTPREHLYLLDFGLTRRIDHDDSTADTAGTAAYMAPEQLASGAATAETDFYAVGTLLFEAVTGKLPYSGTLISMAISKQKEPPPALSALVRGVPEALDSLCRALLDFEPARRPTARRMLQLLGESTTTLSLGPGSSLLPRSGPFLGREREVEVLRRAFQETTRGKARAVRVLGPSGLGKTTLVRHVTDELLREHDDVVVLRGRCHERERVPYQGLDGIMDALSRHLARIADSEVRAVLPRFAGMLPRVFPVLGRVEAIAQAPRPAGTNTSLIDQRERVVRVLRELFDRFAERRRLVIVLDDVQWCDPDSRVVLRELFRSPEAPAMLLCFTERERAQSEPEVDSFSVPCTTETVQLGPLELRACAELAAELMRALGTPIAADPYAIAREAAGHPLYVDELVRLAATMSASALGEFVAPIRLDDAIWLRICELDERVRHVLLLICVSVAAIPREVLASAVRIVPDDLSRMLGVLRVANLVQSTTSRGTTWAEPYHTRVREVVVARVPQAEVRDLHLRLAQAFERSEAPIAHRAELLLHHYEAAGDSERASENARAAARQARDGLAFERAAQLFENALRLSSQGSETDHRNFEIELAHALVHAGRGRDAATAFLRAAQGADATTALDCHRHAAEQLLVSGHIDDGLRAMDSLLSFVGMKLEASPTGTVAGLLWYRARIRVHGLRWKQRHKNELSGAELTRVDVFKAVAHGLLMVDSVRGMYFQARGLLLALQLGEPVRVGTFLAREAVTTAAEGVGRRAHATHLLDLAREIGTRENDPYLQVYTRAVQGVLHYFMGELSTAVDHLDQSAEEVRSVPGMALELNTVQMFLMLTLRQLGALKRARTLYDGAVHEAERRGDRHAGTTLRRVGHPIWLAQNEPDQLRRELALAAWTPPVGSLHLQHWYEIEALGQLALYEGDVDAAHSLIVRLDALERSLLMRVQTVRIVVGWLRGRLLLLIGGDPRTARRKVEAIVRKLAAEDYPTGAVFAYMLGAGLAELRAESAHAESLWQVAVHGADKLGLALVAAAARRRLGRLVQGVEGDALESEALRFMRAQGVVDADRMTQMIATSTRSID